MVETVSATCTTLQSSSNSCPVSIGSLLAILRLALLKNLERFLCGLHPRNGHSSKCRAFPIRLVKLLINDINGEHTHAVGAVDFTELHTADNETRNNLTGPLDDGVLGSVHVQAPHTAKLLDLLHADKPLDTEGTKWTIVASSADDERGVDGVRIHAALVVMVHGDESPVGDNTSDADLSIRASGASDEVLDRCGVEKLDVGESEDFAEQSGSEEGGVFDDDVVFFFFVWDAEVTEEGVCRLTHDHG